MPKRTKAAPRGRPPSGDPRRTRSIRATDDEWTMIEAAAQATGETTTAYMLRRALTPDRLGRKLSDARQIGEQLQGALAELWR